MMKKSKTLILLDLDHTLIYGSYAEKEAAEFLFQYNNFLKVYVRHLAHELIEICKNRGDIIVFTTALRSYAQKISNRLDINPIELLSRKNCILINQKHYKKVKQDWLDLYEQIIIIDDSPNVWINSTNAKITFLVPNEFRGQENDMGLLDIISSNL